MRPVGQPHCGGECPRGSMINDGRLVTSTYMPDEPASPEGARAWSADCGELLPHANVRYAHVWPSSDMARALHQPNVPDQECNHLHGKNQACALCLPDSSEHTTLRRAEATLKDTIPFSSCGWGPSCSCATGGLQLYLMALFHCKLCVYADPMHSLSSSQFGIGIRSWRQSLLATLHRF